MQTAEIHGPGLEAKTYNQDSILKTQQMKSNTIYIYIYIYIVNNNRVIELQKY